MRLTTPFVRAVVIVVAVAGCGGAGGVRRKMISFEQDAGALPGYQCSTDQAKFDCTAPVKLGADGHLVDFSPREWNSTGGKWCNESGYHGAIYGYTNTAFPADTHTEGVNADEAFHLALSVTGGQYGGGGLAFEGGCMDITPFTGIRFTAAIVSGSLANCPLQLQLPTYDQRPTNQTPPGGCDPDGGSCFNYPTATALPSLSSDPANPTPVVLPFTAFSRIATEMLGQIVGVQWQVNATGGNCMVELALDNIAFIPGAAPTDGGSDAVDGGTVDDASAAQ
jgi:hypothetical protein